MNRVRLQKLGVHKYMWHHSRGSLHPRKLHEKYDGQIFEFDNPPIIDEKTGERGGPGQLVNCHCFAAPVVTFGEDE